MSVSIESDSHQRDLQPSRAHKKFLYYREFMNMEKTRYFRTSNKFNDIINLLSGNDFPLSDENTSLSLASLLWVIFVWILKVVYLLTGMLGTLYFGNLTVGEMFTKSGSMAAVCAELIIPTVYLNFRRKELRDLISKYNDMLIDSDDLKRYIRDTFDPYKKGFKVYIIAGLSANLAWSGVPILRVFENDSFTYVDYTVPAYLPGEPFGAHVFIAGLIFTIVGSSIIHFGKISVDCYVSHLVTVLAAQYKYVRAQMTEALSEENNEMDDMSVIVALQKCVRHHCAIIEAGQILTKLLALHVGATYLNVILKFCFLAFGLMTLGDVIIKKITYTLYSFACLVQVFLLCSCVQELLDTSTSVADDAFHGTWHSRGKAVKRMFWTIELSNHMECRLSAYRIVDLIVPTLASILSKSYSLCLLLLNVN